MGLTRGSGPRHFQEMLNRSINIAKAGGLTVAQITTAKNATVTALGADTTTRDVTLQTPPKALLPDLDQK